MQDNTKNNGAELNNIDKGLEPDPITPETIDEGTGAGGCNPAPVWRRGVAFLIDSVILGITGFIIVSIFFNGLVSLGPYARFLGYLIAVFYYGCFNCEHNNGQTPGKRIMKVRVVNARGETIPFETSLIRAAFLMLPLTLKHIGPAIPSTTDTSFQFLAMLNFLITCLGTGIIYFFIFNRQTRQSLHDLICGTFVVNSEGSGCVITKKMWKGHYAVYGALLFLQVILFVGVVLYLINILPPGFLGLYNDLWKIRDVNEVNFQYKKVMKLRKDSYNVMSIQLYFSDPRADLKKRAIEGLRIVTARRHVFKYTDVVNVSAIIQADIGIAYRKKEYTETWQLNKNKPPFVEGKKPKRNIEETSKNKTYERKKRESVPDLSFENFVPGYCRIFPSFHFADMFTKN